MKKTVLAVLAAALLTGGAGAPAHAAESKPQASLKQTFDRAVILPYDYHQKAFIRGIKTEVYGNYKLLQRDNRVLVPIRLMGYLAGQAAGSEGGSWEIAWSQQRPSEVVLTNAGLKRSLVFTVGSKTMKVNGKDVAIDVAPYKVDGTILLPLRSASEALEKNIQWLDGLIIIGDETVDPQSVDTRSLLAPIKQQLSDNRAPAEVESSTSLLTRLGNTSYYFRSYYTANTTSELLYKQQDGGKPVQIKLAGQPRLSQAKTVDGIVYYPVVEGGKSLLYGLDPAVGKAVKIAALGTWKPEDGWLQDVRKLGGELFVNLHVGDNTMGSETLYRIVGGALKEAGGGKSLPAYARDGDRLLYTDFTFMTMKPGNLKQVDLKTGKTSSLGDQGFTYGIYRKINEGGTSYQASSKLYIRDGSVYALGYEETDETAVSAVYRIPLDGKPQTRITPPASDFWLEGNSIYSIDPVTGKLGSTGLSGGESRIVIDRRISDAMLVDGSLYYLVKPGEGTTPAAGVLYRYDLAGNREIKLSDKPVSSFEVGGKGVYYISSGYEPGLYKIGADGRSTALMRDSISQLKLTPSGVMYTQTYKSGVFSAN